MAYRPIVFLLFASLAVLFTSSSSTIDIEFNTAQIHDVIAYNTKIATDIFNSVSSFLVQKFNFLVWLKKTIINFLVSAVTVINEFFTAHAELFGTLAGFAKKIISAWTSQGSIFLARPAVPAEVHHVDPVHYQSFYGAPYSEEYK